MSKKYSLKFWITFWAGAAVFLAGWYIYWETRRDPNPTADSPLEQGTGGELKTVAKFVDYLLTKDDVEKIFLVLFQNNMEIRPGGGYIGSFGVLKIKNGEVVSLETHDLSNFDGRIPDTVKPPYPMGEMLNIKSWKMRDSNWSPDWPTNAQKAEEFYLMGQGQEKFDGIISINATVLASFLKVTGPVTVPGYSQVFDSEDAILNLENQVEKQYMEENRPVGERKSIMTPLAKEIISKITDSGLSQKIELAKVIREDLNRKDIQLYFKNEELQKEAQKSGWAGEIDATWAKDYLLMVDANLGALKSDYYIKRSFDYTVDFSGQSPKAILKITYNHTAKTKDWMTSDYRSYLRVYVPGDSWLTSSKNTGEMKYEKDLGKKYFGTLIQVPLGQSKTIEFNYDLPKNFTLADYEIFIQKQSGVSSAPGVIHLINPAGEEEKYEVTLDSDWLLNS